MLLEEIKRLSEYGHEIRRASSKVNGVGVLIQKGTKKTLSKSTSGLKEATSRVNNESNQHVKKNTNSGPLNRNGVAGQPGPSTRRESNKETEIIWPSGAFEPKAECNKLLTASLKTSIGQPEQIKLIESVVTDLYTSLKRRAICGLFDRYCPKPKRSNHEQSDNFRVYLNAYTNYCEVFDFLYHLMSRIKLKKCRQKSIHYLFGCNRNFAIYKRHLKWMIMANARVRYVTIGRFVCTEGLAMDLDKVEWLSGLEVKLKYRIFIKVMEALTKHLVEVIRRYFYIVVSNPYVNKLFYYRHDLWQKIREKTIQDHISRGLLRQFRIRQQPELVSKLRFMLKKNDIRLLCTKVGEKRAAMRTKSDRLHAVLIHLVGSWNKPRFRLDHLLEGAKELRKQSEQRNEPIYFVRADIEDCFHSIKQEKLRLIILRRLRDLFKNGQIVFSKVRCTYKGGRPKNGSRETSKTTIDIESLGKCGQFDNVFAYKTDKVSLQDFDVNYLSPQIIEPILRESITSKFGYNLISGIRQGSRFSPLFCTIYIQEAFDHNLGDLVDENDSQLYYYVDDILYMTTNLEKAKKFMQMIVGGFEEFGLRTNVNKLACNFSYPEHQVRLLDEFVVFYRRQINLKTLQCSYDYSYDGVTIDNTFHVSPYLSQGEISKCMERLTKIELIHLDCELNGRDLVIENIFHNALLMAHRLATFILCSLELSNHQAHQQPEFVEHLCVKVARKYNARIRSGLSRQSSIVNNLNVREVHLVTLAAFCVTWKTNKVRHRAMERDKLEKNLERKMMKYLVDTRNELDEALEFEKRIKKLIRDFPTSVFAQEVLLPDKK